jgi:hypothetical protein
MKNQTGPDAAEEGLEAHKKNETEPDTQEKHKSKLTRKKRAADTGKNEPNPAHSEQHDHKKRLPERPLRRFVEEWWAERKKKETEPDTHKKRTAEERVDEQAKSETGPDTHKKKNQN